MDSRPLKRPHHEQAPQLTGGVDGYDIPERSMSPEASKMALPSQRPRLVIGAALLFIEGWLCASFVRDGLRESGSTMAWIAAFGMVVAAAIGVYDLNRRLRAIEDAHAPTGRYADQVPDQAI